MSVKAVIDEALTELAACSNIPYDGVMGLLPDWMPQPLKIEFRDLRAGLLGCQECDEKHAPKQLQRWLTIYQRTGETQTIIHARDLRDLDYIKSIADLGPEEGLKTYLGKGAAAIYRKDVFAERQRAIACKPREDGLTRAIVALLKEKPTESQAFQYVLNKLEAAARTRVPIEGTKIEGISEDGEIEWSDARTDATSSKLSALKSRISRAAQKVKAA